MSSASPWQSPGSLPKEILSHIFVANVENNYRHSLEDSVRLSHVCQYWRHAAISEDILWSTVNFKNKQLALLALSRSKVDTHLRVELSPIGTPAEDPDAYALVKANWFRIHSLYISPDDPDENFPAILQFFVDNPPPDYTLKVLSMSSENYYDLEEDDTDYEEEDTSLALGFPPPADRKPVADLLAKVETLRSVENLYLCCVEVPTRSSLYDNLVYLELYDNRPPIPTTAIIDVFRRSPRLRSIRLEMSYGHDVPDPSEDVPPAELLDLKELDLRSKTFDSTVFILGHIIAPKLFDVYIQAKSDNRGAELAQLLAPLRDSKVLLSITDIDLCDQYDGSIVLRSDYHINDSPDSKLHVRLKRATWDGQCRVSSGSFLQLFPLVRKARLHSSSTKVSPLFRGLPVDELVVSGFIDTQVFYEMSPGRSLEKVHTLQLDADRFSEYAEVGLRALARTKSLKLLRLVVHENLNNRERREFVAFGVKNGIWLQWVKYDRSVGWEEPGLPARKEKRIHSMWSRRCSDNENDTDEEISDKEAGAKRTRVRQGKRAGKGRSEIVDMESESELEPEQEPSQKLSFHMAFLRRKPGEPVYNPYIEDNCRDWEPLYRQRSYDDIVNRRYEDVMREYEGESKYESEEDGMDVD